MLPGHFLNHDYGFIIESCFLSHNRKLGFFRTGDIYMILKMRQELRRKDIAVFYAAGIVAEHQPGVECPKRHGCLNAGTFFPRPGPWT